MNTFVSNFNPEEEYRIRRYNISRHNFPICGEYDIRNKKIIGEYIGGGVMLSPQMLGDYIAFNTIFLVVDLRSAIKCYYLVENPDALIIATLTPENMRNIIIPEYARNVINIDSLYR